MKYVWISGILSLLQPGIGQLYTGRRRRGILFIVGQLIVTFLNAFFDGLLVLIFYGVYIWAIVDAVLLARKQNREKFLRGRRLVVELGLAIILSLSLMVVAQFLGEWSLSQLNQIVFQGGSPEDHQKVKAETQRYLKHKYEEEFVVKKINHIFMAGNYEILVSPKKQPQLEFSVTCDESLSSFHDRYPNEVWSKQAEREINPVVKQAFSSSPYHLKVGVGVDETVVNDFKGDVPSIKEARERYPDSYSQSIILFVIKDVPDPSLEADKIYQLVSFVQEEEIPTSIRIEYYDEKLLDKGVKEVNPDNSDDYTDYLKNIVGIGSEEREQRINSPEGVERYFKQIDN